MPYKYNLTDAEHAVLRMSLLCYKDHTTRMITLYSNSSDASFVKYWQNELETVSKLYEKEYEYESQYFSEQEKK